MNEFKYFNTEELIYKELSKFNTVFCKIENPLEISKLICMEQSYQNFTLSATYILNIYKGILKVNIHLKFCCKYYFISENSNM